MDGVIYRKSDTWTNIAISILIILIYNPFLINSISVLLSYGGTIGIIVFSRNVSNLLAKIKIKDKKIKYKINKRVIKIVTILKEILAITISAQIAIMPIMIICFNTSGIAFLLTNVAVSLIIGPIVILGFTSIIILFISTELLKMFSYILNPMLQLLVTISTLGNKMPLNKFYVATPEILEIFIYYISIFILNYLYKIYTLKKLTAFQIRIKNLISLFKYRFKQNKKRALSLAIIFCITFSIIQITPKNLNIYFVDVGQGDCTLITTPNKKTILIDGGGSMSNDYDVGESTVLPYLLDRKVTKINYMIVSHFDQDHVGGLLTVLKELQVDNVIIAKQLESTEQYEELKQIVKEKRINIKVVKAGNKIVIEKDLYFNVLYPIEDMITENAINNNSLVLKLAYKNFSMLFTGDIEKIAEQDIIGLYKDTKILKSNIIKIAHHGSKTSSTQEFIELVNPEIALIGVGENNLYGHPADTTINTLKQMRNKYI